MTNEGKLENHKRDCILITLKNFNVDKEILKGSSFTRKN